MESFNTSANSPVILSVKISSAAIVGSNVSIDDVLIEESIAYNFSKDLGNSNSLNDKKLSIVSNFSVDGGDNIDDILNNTNVTYTLKDSNNSNSYIGKKRKINKDNFTIYLVIKLVPN